MKMVSRPVLISIFLLLLIGSSCNMPAPTRIPVGPIGFNPTSTPMPTETGVAASDTPIAPVIPITGENVVQMQCQFCVNERTHAIFVFPEFALFDVETTITNPVTCLTAEVVNGKRVVVCHGTQQTSFNLKICSDTGNCLLFPVALQACPLVPNTGTSLSTGTPMTPVFLTPLHTLRPTNTDDLLPPPTLSGGVTPSPSTPTMEPSSTPVPTSIVPTIVPTGIINTPVPTATDPVVLTEPPSTPEPLSTSTSDDNKKDTKTPKVKP